MALTVVCTWINSLLNLVYGPIKSNKEMDKKFEELWSLKKLLALILG